MSSSPTSSSSTDASGPFLGMLDVRCKVDVVVGHGSITVRDCLRLRQDSVIRLVETAGDDLVVHVQGIAAATGEIVVDDETTSVKITAILPPPGGEGER